MGFLATTTLRILAFDQNFDEQGLASFVSIPYRQVTALAAQDEERDVRSGDTFSQLIVMTPAGTQRFVLNAPGLAAEAERQILMHILNDETSIQSWATVFRAGDLVMERMDPGYRAAAPSVLLEQAREAARSGRDPSQALADVLTDVGLLNERS